MNARTWFYGRSGFGSSPMFDSVEIIPAAAAPKASGFQQITYPAELMLKQDAKGPVSYRMDGERLTFTGRETFCSSTYMAMIDRGWAKSLPEVD